MCRRLVVAIATLTAMAAVSADALAAGAPMRKPPVPVGTTPAMAVPGPPASAPPAAVPTPGPLLGGCGRGRVRDPHTNLCRGPADVSR